MILRPSASSIYCEPAMKKHKNSDEHSEKVEEIARELTRIVDTLVAQGQYSDHEAAIQGVAQELRIKANPLEKPLLSSPISTKVPSDSPPSLLALFDIKTLATTVFVFTIIIVKVMAVVRFDSTTALALVGAAGPISVIVGSIISSISALAPAVLLFSVAGFEEYRRQRGATWLEMNTSTVQLIALIVLGLLLIEAFMTSTKLFMANASFVALTVLTGLSKPMARGFKKRYERNTSGVLGFITARGGYIVLVIGLAIGTAGSLLGSSMWLPAERISLTNQPTTIGYVLDDDGEWGTLLSSDDRTIRKVAVASILDRTVCRVGDSNREASSLYRRMARAVGSPINSNTPRC
jgi:hypothetical protein